jgi:DNA ligase-1
MGAALSFVRLALGALLFAGIACAVAAGNPPPLLLAKDYRGDVRLADYWVSEKFDGVRGYWDGSQLWTRGGLRIDAPAWFTSGWPALALDGELWAGRGQFAAAASIVRRQPADDADWRRMRFMVFDLPSHPGNFTERLEALRVLLAQLDQPWVRPVEQVRVMDETELRALFDRVVMGGGEGLMLHRADSRYRAERSDDLLKLKPYDDADARVLGHVPGRGRYRGRLGALVVETPEGLRFRIGSGLSDADREHPPPLGTWISYRHRGVNEKTGVPRFASFLRVREDLAEPNQPGAN